jgi:hypothetical protein
MKIKIKTQNTVFKTNNEVFGAIVMKLMGDFNLEVLNLNELKERKEQSSTFPKTWTVKYVADKIPFKTDITPGTQTIKIPVREELPPMSQRNIHKRSHATWNQNEINFLVANINTSAKALIRSSILNRHTAKAILTQRSVIKLFTLGRKRITNKKSKELILNALNS